MSKMNYSLARNARRYYKRLKDKRTTVISTLNNYRKMHGIPMHRTVHMKRIVIGKAKNGKGIPKHQ